VEKLLKLFEGKSLVPCPGLEWRKRVIYLSLCSVAIVMMPHAWKIVPLELCIGTKKPRRFYVMRTNA